MAGDLTTEDFQRFYATSYPSILGVVTLVTGSRAAAEDLVQEALARAWERPSAKIRDLDRWVLTVALNLGRNRWRKLRREVLRDHSNNNDDDHESRPTDELSLDLRAALRRLPTRQREVVVLHYLLDLSVADIAELAGLSEGGVKHALFRARQSLNTLLTVEDPDVTYI